MRPRATVLVPTFDHGPTLRHSLASARRQTVEELEIFVVGDGAPAVTRRILAKLEREDPRVRFFENPKGPSHGEIHRRAALEHASGEIVCYLSDDDLWLPDHVESMLELLAAAEFAHCLPVYIDPDGAVKGWTLDLREEADRQLLLDGENRIPLSCSAHTLAAYRRLPHGWRTTPQGPPTDLYMFQQFLREPWVRAVSGTRPTCLHFPSPDRPGVSLDRRCAELDLWAGRVADGSWRSSVWPRLALQAHTRGWALSERDLRAAGGALQEARRELAESRQRAQLLEEQLAAARQAAAAGGADAAAARQQITQERAERQAALQELDAAQAERQAVRDELDDARQMLQAARGELGAAREERHTQQRELDESHQERQAALRALDEGRQAQQAAAQELAALHATLHTSLTHRLRRRLLSVPLLGRLLRSAARALARRADR